ncbi:MAG: hypothetical protein QOG50_887 [Actinomycetota bacterium]|nr:hypothetical protein [Actinomycetota bacterium]
METREVVVPETMPMERLEAEITQLAGHLAAAECQWMLLIAEFDRRAGYESWGCRTCSHWLSWHCGLDLRAAREHVRVARALKTLPLITQEFAAGKLSYSKVRALTRVATPENEADLAMIAEHATAVQVERTFAPIEKFCRRTKSSTRPTPATPLASSIAIGTMTACSMVDSG